MIVLRLIFWLLDIALWLADVGLLAYVVLSYIRSMNPTVNRVKQALSLVCEPMLIPARRVLGRFVPSRFMFVDWSPILVWIVLGIARNILDGLEGIIL
ncbi:MAG: YggT family protein [Clostridia bacterium]|nr:YggT family protein [Clostridia bacterium]